MPTTSVQRARRAAPLLAIAVVLAACGGEEEAAAPAEIAEADPTTSTASTTSATEAEPEPDEPAITQAEFVERANAICDAGNAEIDADPGSNAPGGIWFAETVIPNIRQQVADIRAVGFPSGDEELLGSIFDDTEVVLDELEAQLQADPQAFGTGPNPFANLNQRLIDYGLIVCGGE